MGQHFSRYHFQPPSPNFTPLPLPKEGQIECHDMETFSLGANKLGGSSLDIMFCTFFIWLSDRTRFTHHFVQYLIFFSSFSSSEQFPAIAELVPSQAMLLSRHLARHSDRVSENRSVDLLLLARSGKLWPLNSPYIVCSLVSVFTRESRAKAQRTSAGHTLWTADFGTGHCSVWVNSAPNMNIGVVNE